MSLACLTCQTVQRTHSDLSSYSFGSQDEGGCGFAVRCWNKKSPQPLPPPRSEVNTVPVKARVVPVPLGGGSTSQDPVSPRLTRCHAVRRDIFRDWHFEDSAEGNRLCLT